MSEPLHSTGTTRTLRTVSKVLHIIEFVCSIICLVGFLIAGPILIVIPTVNGLLTSADEAELAGGIMLLTWGITLIALAIFLMIPYMIYEKIALEQVQKEGHKQFLPLAIVGGILGDYVNMAFAIVIYIFEGRLAKRDELL